MKNSTRLKRTPLKRGTSMLKPGNGLKRGKPLKKRSARQIEKDKGKGQRQINDWNFYLSIWNERPHKCEETGRPLGWEPLTTMFHHILEKENYPQYRYEKWNIALLHPDVHDQVGRDLDKTPKTKARREELLVAGK